VRLIFGLASVEEKLMVRKTSGFVAVFIAVLFAATSASAQDQTVRGLKLSFDTAAAPSVDLSVRPLAPASVSFLTDAAPMRRQTTSEWIPMILAGLAFNGGGGFAVGGGVLGMNFLGDERFMLQIDGLYESVGDCAFDACSAYQIAIGAMFLFKFAEMTNGWTPFVGAGIVWSRVAFSFDDDFFCDEFFFDCDLSSSGVGIQVGGGMDKDKIGFEFRFGGVHGGGGAILFRYRFR
jgi:hypothetical protein